MLPGDLVYSAEGSLGVACTAGPLFPQGPRGSFAYWATQPATPSPCPLAIQGTSAFPSYGYLAESAVFASSNGTQGIPFYLLQSSCAQLRPNIRVPYKLPNIGLTLNISESRHSESVQMRTLKQCAS